MVRAPWHLSRGRNKIICRDTGKGSFSSRLLALALPRSICGKESVDVVLTQTSIRLKLVFDAMYAICKFFDISVEAVSLYLSVRNYLQVLKPYPLLGPLFCGTRLNRHLMDDLAQLEQGASPVSDWASHLIFFLRHSSHALDTFDRFLGGMLLSMGYWGPIGGPTETDMACDTIWSLVGVS